jgi:hypothetical protein
VKFQDTGSHLYFRNIPVVGYVVSPSCDVEPTNGFLN